jgi:hypothetical protein
MKKKIQIYDFVFNLNITDDIVTTSSFHMIGRKPDDFQEAEFKQGQIYQQEIFDGKHDWLIKKGIITLPTHNILVTVTDVIFDGSIRFGGGSIQSCLKETCPHCQDPKCDFDCPEALGWASSMDVEDCQANNEGLACCRHYNFACDAIESMVLNLAIAGVNIESPAFLEGLEAAIDGIANNI